MMTVDGLDHINVYSKAKTELGRWLSNFAFTPLVIPGDGHFDSIECYWHWLLTGDERLRHMASYAAKRLGRILRPRTAVFNKTQKEKLLAAIDLKINQDPIKRRLLQDSTLPLTHYYEVGDPPLRKDGGHRWVIDHLVLRRQQLQQDVFPFPAPVVRD